MAVFLFEHRSNTDHFFFPPSFFFFFKDGNSEGLHSLSSQSTDENIPVTQSAKLLMHPYTHFHSSEKSISDASNSASCMLRSSPILSGTANTDLIPRPTISVLINICVYEMETGTVVHL